VNIENYYRQLLIEDVNFLMDQGFKDGRFGTMEALHRIIGSDRLFVCLDRYRPRSPGLAVSSPLGSDASATPFSGVPILMFMRDIGLSRSSKFNIQNNLYGLPAASSNNRWVESRLPMHSWTTGMVLVSIILVLSNHR
jgi:hypothetical protein